MPRLPVRLTEDALKDLAQIRTYYRSEVGPAVATRVLGRIRKKLAQIQRSPHSGSMRPEFGAAVRFHVSGSYVIYVDVTEARVDVLRILHAARDRDAIMRPKFD